MISADADATTTTISQIRITYSWLKNVNSLSHITYNVKLVVMVSLYSTNSLGSLFDEAGYFHFHKEDISFAYRKLEFFNKNLTVFS